jgi:hypothetical protein
MMCDIMNRKGDEKTIFIWFALGIFVLILLILILGKNFGLFNRGTSPECPESLCYAKTSGCPDEKVNGEILTESPVIFCKDKTMMCCTSSSDPMGKKAASEAQNEGTDTPADDGTTATPITASKILILMNDGKTQIPPTVNVEIGQSYEFTITGYGQGSDKCVIQVMDSNQKIVAATWIQDVPSGQVACTSASPIKIHLTPGGTEWNLDGKKYTLYVGLYKAPDSTDTYVNPYVAESKITLNLALSAADRAVKAKANIN